MSSFSAIKYLKYHNLTSRYKLSHIPRAMAVGLTTDDFTTNAINEAGGCQKLCMSTKLNRTVIGLQDYYPGLVECECVILKCGAVLHWKNSVVTN